MVINQLLQFIIVRATDPNADWWTLLSAFRNLKHEIHLN